MHVRALRDAAKATSDSLDAASRANSVEALTRRLFALESRLQRHARGLLPPPGPEACRAGCSYCCYQNVAISPPEVIGIACYLHATLPPEEVTGLAAQVVGLVSQMEGVGERERFLRRIPCPLLRGGRCLVYPLRPLACRGDNSLDASVCATAFLNPEAGGGMVPVEYAPQRAIASGLLWGTVDALDEAGLEAGPLELTRALAIALARQDSAEAWLRGERVFQSAAY